MKPFTGTALLGAVVAAPIVFGLPATEVVEKRNDPKMCHIDAATIDDWTEYARTKYRFAFHSDGPNAPDPHSFCDWWDPNGLGNQISAADYFKGTNVQRYFNKDIDGGKGSWVVDASWAMGAGGSAAAYCNLDRTRMNWRDKSNCQGAATGAS